MAYIYHGVPKNLEGSHLKPLFTLKEENPEIYYLEVKKYDDHPQRKKLPFKMIPKLDCMRGEVLHCSSIHPHLVFKALKSVFPEGNRSVLFYKIPVKSLENYQLVLFDINHPDYKFGQENDAEAAFELINHNFYQEIQEVPEEAYQFYKEWKEKGEKGAPAWGKIPHVFVKGNIDTRGLEVIDWKNEIT